MSIVRDIEITIWGSKDEINEISAVIQKAVTDVAIENKQTIRIESSSCINKPGDLGRIAVDMVSANQSVWFDIEATASGMPLKFSYENSILRMVRHGKAFKITLPEELIPLINLISDLEDYYESAGFADFYNRVLQKMSEEEIRDYHKRTFEEGFENIQVNPNELN